MQRIRFSDERRRDFVERLQRFHRGAFDEELSVYRAERLLEFFAEALGPSVYNQAIQDARGFLQAKLDDLDAEFYEPDQGATGPRADD